MQCATLPLHLREWLPGTLAGTVVLVLVLVVATAPADRSTFPGSGLGFRSDRQPSPSNAK
ncbi:hypothetical protein [Streptomyces sp. 1222.5]|uniref:hypothetical protein n=1 Tax=Streptomyces sp. 1222.5 TaxID=1881026 RepID=UPI003D702C7D